MKAIKFSNLISRSILIALSVFLFGAFQSAKSQVLTVEIQSIGGFTEYCQGSTIILSVDVSGGNDDNIRFDWSGDTHVFSSIVPPGDVVFVNSNVAPGDYYFEVEVEDSDGNIGSDNITITLLESPPASIVAEGPTTFCNGGSVTLRANEGVGYTYQWTRNGANIAGATGVTYVATTGGNYRVRVFAGNGCSRLSNIIGVTVNALPSPTASNDSPVCEGGTVNFTGLPNGMVTYAWTGPGIVLDNDQNPTYIGVGLTFAGVYTLTVTDANGCSNTATTNVVIRPLPVAPTSVTSDRNNICAEAGGNITLTAVGGSGGFGHTLKWYTGSCGGTHIGDGNNLVIPAPIVTTTYYALYESEHCGQSSCASVTVTVYAPLNGGAIGSNQSICYGDIPAAFTNVTSPSGGFGAWTYQWQFQVGAGPWTNISGANAQTYSVGGPLTQTTNYRRLSTNTCGTIESNVITVTVSDALNGGAIAANQSICYNTVPAPFTNVTAPSGGSGAFSYQWQFQVGAGPWTNIVGANALTYSVPTPLTTTTNYRRVSTNTCGSAQSNVITVTVYAQLNGGTIASNQSICYNTVPAPFTNVLSPSGGTGAWTYQWQYRLGPGPWTNIVGANAITYAVTDPLTVTTFYRRLSTNTCGSIESNIITVTVFNEINGGTIAANQSVCYGDIPAPFSSVTAPSGGSGAWTYQWQFQVGAGVWTDIAGANALTYAAPGPMTVTTNYRRLSTNTCGTGISNVITVTVADAINGGEIAASQSICYNALPAPFTSVSPASGGTGAMSYQWQSQTGVGPWTNIVGATGLTYSVPSGLTITTNYRRVATNACGSGESNVITVTVAGEISGGTIAADQDICYNTTPAPFTNILSPSGGVGAWTYQWQSQVGAGPWTNIAGANGLAYSVVTPLTVTTRYKRVATNSCGSVDSNVITVSVYGIMDGGVIAANQSICNGDIPAPFTNVTSPSGGFGAWTYQWQYQVGAGVWTNIVGANALTYAVATPLTETTNYRRVATNSCGTVESNIITVTVADALLGGQIAASQTICYGTIPAPFTSISPASGGTGAITYQWQFQIGAGPWTNIAGANGLTYTVLAPLTTTTNYRRLATNACGNSASNTITITVYGQLNADVIVTHVSGCFGNTNGAISITNPVGGSGVYQYSIDGGATWHNSGLFSGLGAGFYSVQIRDFTLPACIVALGVYEITQPAQLSADLTWQNVTECSSSLNGWINITNPLGGSGTYEYSINGGATWQASGLFSGIGAGTYNVQMRDQANPTCIRVLNANLVLTAPQPLTADVASVNVNCFGANNGSITINNPAGGSGAYQYSIDNGLSWQASGDFPNLFAGVYNVVIRDANFITCTQLLAVVTIIQPAQLNATVNFDQISCFGSNDGWINITNPSGGSGAYEYSINNGATWQASGLFEGLVEDTYNVLIRDANNINCFVLLQVVNIVEPAGMTLSFLVIDVDCWGASTGEITVVVVGGTPDYTYLWSNGATTPTISGLTSGNYSVTVTDSQGCTQSGSATVSQPASPLEVYAGPNVTICSGINLGVWELGGTGSVETAEGGQPPYSYVWTSNPPDPTLVGQENDPNPVVSPNVQTVYTVQVTDFFGCVETDFTTIFIYPIVVADAGGNDDGEIHLCDGSSVTLGGTPLGIGNTGYYVGNPSIDPDQFTYRWERLDGAVWTFFANTAHPTVSPATTTTYRVRVRDRHGDNCLAYDTVVVIVTPGLIVTADPDIHNVCNANAAGDTFTLGATIDDQGSGLGASAIITWSSNPFDPTLVGQEHLLNPVVSPIVTTTYTITADYPVGIGCSNFDSMTIHVSPAITVNAGGPEQMMCSPANGGSITLGGTPTASGGTGVLTYFWTAIPADPSLVGQETLPNPTVSPSVNTTYTVLVTDAQGCQASNSVLVNILPQLLADAGSDVTTCFGIPVTIGGMPSAIGGSGSYVYMWNAIPADPSLAGQENMPNPTVEPLVPTVYTLTVTDGLFGCQDIAVVNVNVVPGIDITIYEGANPVCVGTTITLGGSPTATGGNPPLNYRWRIQGVDPNWSELANPTYTINENTTFVLFVFDNVGCWNTESVTINVTTPPVAQIQGDPIREICEGESVTLTAIGDASWDYLWMPGGFTTQTINVSPTETTNYTLTVTNDCGTDNASVQVIVYPSVDIDLANTYVDDVTCSGDDDGSINIALLNTTIVYTFNLQDGLGNILETFVGTQPALFTNLGQGTYFVNITDGHACGTMLAGPFVIIEPDPISIDPASISFTAVICDGDDSGFITIGANGGTGVLYYTLYKDGVIVQGPQAGNGTFTGLEGGTYIVNIIDDAGCSIDSNPITIVVIGGLPNAGDDKEVCVGGSVQIGPDVDPGATTYSWTSIPQDLSLTGQENILNPIVSPLETTTYYLTSVYELDGFTCENIDELVVVVNPLPLALVGSDFSMCLGDVVSIGDYNYEPVPANTYVWTSVPHDSSISNPFVSNPTVSPIVTTVYTLVETYVATGCTNSNSVTVTVNPLPSVYVADDMTICQGDEVYIGSDNEPDLNVTYFWSAYPIPFISAEYNPLVSPESTNTYYLTVTHQPTGCVNMDSVTVTVVEKPLYEISDNIIFCSVDEIVPVYIGGNPLGDYFYTWTSDPENNSLVGQENDSDPLVTVEGTTMFHLMVSAGSGTEGCVARDSVWIFVSDLSVVAWDSPKACEDDDAELGYGIAVSGGFQPYTYQWYDNDGNLIGSIFNPVVTPPFVEPYTIIVTDYYNCSREADVNIEIDVPVVSLEADPDVNLYPNQIVTFTATPDYYENYDFYVNGVLAQTGSLNTFEYVEPQQDDEIIVVVMSEFGCEASSLPLILNLISLPNAFTPNGDGINDIFGKGSDLIIFNRWGQKIYDGVEGWDGTFNGRPVAPGTYYYIQTVYDRNNNQIINKGSVTVIRIRE